jgi:hypothetical protein
MSVINFKVAPNDQESIHIAVEVDGAEVARATLNGDSLDQLISALGRHRASILPIQPDQPNPETMPVLNVQAYGFANQKAEGAPELLAIKHPMFGWLGFTFPDEAVAEIAARLKAEAAAPAKPDKAKH